MLEKQPYTGSESRQDPNRRSRLTVAEQAVEIVALKYGFKKPMDADFAEAQFTGGDEVKRAVKILFDRLEGELDTQKVEKLSEAFDRGVDIWERAGLFTPEREAAGYVKPNFARDYKPLLTQDTLDMAGADMSGTGNDLKRGYGTPVFAPMDVSLHLGGSDQLSYSRLLKEAFLEALNGTTGGKEPGTLYIGREKRVLAVDVSKVKFFDIHGVSGGVSENEVLSQLRGNEKSTGGTMRLERDDLIMPSNVGQEKMSGLEWNKKLPDILPPSADEQTIKQAVAYIIYCLVTQGWMPDYVDGKDSKNSRASLALKSFIPGGKEVPIITWSIGGAEGQFSTGGFDVDRRSNFTGVRVGVRMN